MENQLDEIVAGIFKCLDIDPDRADDRTKTICTTVKDTVRAYHSAMGLAPYVAEGLIPGYCFDLLLDSIKESVMSGVCLLNVTDEKIDRLYRYLQLLA